jgi:hypothetical protein
MSSSQANPAAGAKLYRWTWGLSIATVSTFFGIRLAAALTPNDVVLGLLLLSIGVLGVCAAAAASFLCFFLICYPEVPGVLKLRALLGVASAWLALLPLMPSR